MKEGFDCSVSARLGFFPKFNFPEWLPNKGRGGGAATTGSSPFLESLGEPEFLPAPRDRAAISARAFSRGDSAGVSDQALPQLNSATWSPGCNGGREPQTPAGVHRRRTVLGGARRSPRCQARMQISHVTAKAAWPSPVPQSIYGQRRHGY